MTTEAKVKELEQAVQTLYAEVERSRKREEEAAAFCEDLRTRWEKLGKEGLPEPKPEGVGLGKRGGTDIVFALKLLRKDFRDEEEKVGFIITHLHGEAKSWLRTLWRENDPALNDSDAFLKAMDACFKSTVDVDVEGEGQEDEP
uniref:DUF4939 domain-containing protein n=1 Tax=Podarcis muralis TaxID=64176 RepID=A0A670KH42_PODMU